VRGWIGGPAVVLALVAAPAAAAEEISVTGRVSGSVREGGRLTMTVTATHPEGWRALHELGIDLELNGVALEQIRYDVDRGEVGVGASSALLGTGNVAQGRFVRVPAIDVSQTTGGREAAVTIRARVVEGLPPGSRLRLTAEDDLGAEVTAVRGLPRPESDPSFGFPTLALAVLAALVGGGLVGARIAAHRRPDPRRSVYGMVARRLVEERESHLADREGRR
jgi:hypothetical protein